MDLITDLLKRDEGLRQFAYQDHLGYWTIGYGRMIDRRKGGGISKSEAEYLLRNDIQFVVTTLKGMWPWFERLSETRQAVLVSMAFQMGIGGVAKFHRTLKAIREERWNDAADSMLESLWARQTPGRAYRLSEAMRTDDPAAFRLSEDL